MRNKWAEQLTELVTYDHEAWSINEKKKIIQAASKDLIQKLQLQINESIIFEGAHTLQN